MRFEYASLQALRAEGIDATELPDDRARYLVRLASRRINEVTTQWFCPVWGAWRISGSDSGILIAPQMVPILTVDQLSQYEPYSQEKFPYEPSDFHVVPPETPDELARQIELFTMGGRLFTGGGTFYERRRDFILSQSGSVHDFEHGAGNFMLEGVLGWLENLKNVDQLTTTDVNVGDTEVDLDDVGDIQAGDAVLLGQKLCVILIEVTGNTIKWDWPSEFSIPSGTRVRCFGQVPLDIVRACLMLVIRWKDPIGSDEGQSSVIQGRLMSERTDNYSYTLGKDEGGGGGGGGGTVVTTGDTWVDQILANFVPPPYVGLV
jgi:hypothetical protein